MASSRRILRRNDLAVLCAGWPVWDVSNVVTFETASPLWHAIRVWSPSDTTKCDRCVDSQMDSNTHGKDGHRYLSFKAKHSLLEKVCAGGHPAGGGETGRHPSYTVSHCHCFSHLRAQALRRQFLRG